MAKRKKSYRKKSVKQKLNYARQFVKSRFARSTSYEILPNVNRQRKLQEQATNEQVQIEPINNQKLKSNSVSSPSSQTYIARDKLTNVSQISNIIKVEVQKATVKSENNKDDEVSEAELHSDLQEKLPVQKELRVYKKLPVRKKLPVQKELPAEEQLPVQEQQSDKFSSFCRACAKKNEELFFMDIITSVGISVNAIFNEIGLTISDDDELPKKICKICLDEITSVYKFYKKILDSKSVFERLLLKENNTEPVDVQIEEDDDFNNLEMMEIDENDSLYEYGFQKMCLICGLKELKGDDQVLEHQLSQHVPVSNQEDFTVMTCPHCKTEFSIMLWYDKHLEKCFRRSEPNQCIICKLYIDPNDLDKHLMERHMLEKINSDSFICTASKNCTYFSSSVLMLNEHQMAEHDKSLYVCKDCGWDCIASQELIIHRQIHVKETTWCKLCDIVFDDNETKTRHCQTTHWKKSKSKILCQICGKLYKNGQKHNDVHHSNLKKHCCDKCDMKFSARCYLKQHQNIHNKIKPFKCSECGASFIQQASLIYHMKQHTGEDLLVCSVCDLKFDKSSKLTSHMELHTKAGENPHRCDVCNRMFTHAATLKVHLRVHKTDETVAATSNKNNT